MEDPRSNWNEFLKPKDPATCFFPFFSHDFNLSVGQLVDAAARSTYQLRLPGLPSQGT